MKRKFLFTSACVGFLVAVVMMLTRFYVLQHDPLYGSWFDILTLILWPSAFYLTVMQSAEPPKVVFFVYSVAVLLNSVIYTLIGWLVWSVTKRIRPSNQR